TRGEDADDVAHQAYLAKQQARIAAETAAARAARSEIEQADLERKNVVARARTEELAEQQQQAQAAARSAQAQAEEARQQAMQQQQRSAQEIKRLESQLESLKAEQTNQGWVLTLGGDVLFDVGQAVLKPGA